jgi:hypothetical protein
MDDCRNVAWRLVERPDAFGSVIRADGRQLQARRAGVDDENPVQPGQVQLRTSGWSSPCSRVHAR